MLKQELLINSTAAPASTYTREAITAAPLYAAREESYGHWLVIYAAGDISPGARVSGLSESLYAG